MDLLTPSDLTACYRRAPCATWTEGSRPTDGYGLKRTEGFKGSAGEYYYTLIGGDVKRKHEMSTWSGACFAQWKHLNNSHFLHKVTYRNPLGSGGVELPSNMEEYYAVGWDTVIQPCLPTLPKFEELCEVERLEFDVDDGSLVEASFLFRMARIFSECESFATACTLLRHEFPDAPAEVLFAQAALGRLSINGWENKPHPAYPNCTVQMFGQLANAMSFVRNLIWSRRTGRWDIRKLTKRTEFSGPHSRRYFGHNEYWYGEKNYFKVTPTLDGQSKRRELNNSNLWYRNAYTAAQREEIMHFQHELLSEVYAHSHKMAIDTALEMDISDFMDEPWFRKKWKAEEGRSRIW